MSEYEIEVFRAEANDLTDKLKAFVLAETAGLPRLDRNVIAGVAMANVACLIDGQIFHDDGITGVVARCADGWRRGQRA